jgi:hypothetical protein
MNADHDLERRLADFYETEAPTRAPDWVLGSALTTIDTTPQRHVLIRVPRRFQSMNSFAKLAVAAVVVIAVGALGLAVLRPGSGPGVGGGASSAPSPSLSAAPSVSPSPAPSDPSALTETYTSVMHGISVSYPAGWKLQPATEPWATGFVQGESPYADIIYQKEEDSPFIAVASQALLGGTADRWATDYLAELQCPATPVPVTVDGASGVFADCEDGPYAFVSVDDRGYLIWLYRIDDPDWFQEILATVLLHPEDALDAPPSASPSGS